MGLSPLLLLRLQGTLRLRLYQLLAIFILSVNVHFGETCQNMMNLLPMTTTSISMSGDP